MVYEVQLVKKKRLLVGLSQKELAKRAGVSQSLIAKLERGKLRPSFDVVKKVFGVLESESKQDEKKCSDIMCKKIVFLGPSDLVESVSDLMHKHSFSQIPVIDNGRVVGNVSEGLLLDKLTNGISHDDLIRMRVSEIMDDPLPMVSIDSRVNSIIPLVKEFGCILILKKGNLSGIISRSDLI